MAHPPVASRIGLTNRTKSPPLSSEALTLRVELPALQRLTTKEAAAPEASHLKPDD